MCVGGSRSHVSCRLVLLLPPSPQLTVTCQTFTFSFRCNRDSECATASLTPHKVQKRHHVDISTVQEMIHNESSILLSIIRNQQKLYLYI